MSAVTSSRPNPRVGQHLNSFFSFSCDLLCIANFDGYFLELNPAWTKTLGWTEKELTSNPYLHFVHPEDRASTMQAAEALRVREVVTEFRNRYRRKDGSYACLEWTARSDGNEDIIFAIARDKTNEVEKERSIRSLSSLVDSLTDPVYVLSPQRKWQVVYANEAACRHFGYSRQQLLKMTVPEFDPNYPAERLESTWKEIREKGGIIFETLHRRNTGEVFPVQVSASYIHFDGEECIGGFIQDIRKRKLAEEKLRSLAERLRCSLSELEQFVGVVSHDLRAPLRTISLYLQLLRQNEGRFKDATSEQYFGRAVEASRQLHLLIQDLLEYYSVGNQPEKEFIDLNEVVGRTIAQMEESISNVSARVTHDRLPSLESNRNLLGLVFQNLIENAIKYRSDVPPRIHISARTEDQRLIISVSDNGIGIAPKDQTRIFGIFQRVNGRAEGTGIGLATCKKIVSSLGGELSIRSELGKGAEFLISIPYRTQNITSAT